MTCTIASLGAGSTTINIGGAVVMTADRAVVTNGSGELAVATTTATEIGYVNGVTSAIQTQLNAKAAFSFVTIDCPAGTDPVADSTSDTLTLTSTGGTVTITGDSATDTINFEAAAAGASDAAWTTSTSNTNNDLAYATGAHRFNSASQPNLTGVVAQADGTLLVLHNIFAGGNMIIHHESASSAAANRFTNAGSANILLPKNQGIMYKYSTATSRWVLADIIPITATGPLSLSAAGAMSIPLATSGVSGYLSSTDWTTFNNKVGGSGTSAQIAFFTGSTTLASETLLSWDSTKNRLGVQVAPGFQAAAMHLYSNTATAITGPTSFTARLSSFSPIDEPSGSAAPIQIAGRLMNPDSPSAAENSSGVTGWQIGDTLEYRISPYYDTGSGYIEGAQYTDFATVTMAAGNNGVDLSWSDDTSGSQTISGYILYRNYNSAGFIEWLDLGLVTSYVDDETAFNSGSYPQNTQYDDYIADGTSRDYEYFSRAVIGPGPYFSALSETATTLTDDNTGKPYGVRHNVVGPEALVRIIGNPTGTGNGYKIDGAESTNIDEYEGTWAEGDAAPSSVGYLSDNSILNRSYAFYKTQDVNGNTVYSAGTGDGTTDPDDAAYYYITLSGSWPNPSSGSKIISAEAAAGKTITGGTSMTWYDTNNAYGTDFPNDTTITPEGIIPAALITQKSGNENDFAWLTVKGDNDYSRQEFTSSTDAVQGKFESSTTELAIGYNTAKNIRLNATQLGFYNVTPVTRETTAGAAATIVAGAGNAVLDDDTFDGYTLAQVVKALRNLGILT